jgi:radical SAM protein with 4Fe4S-binding SPASM domain
MEYGIYYNSIVFIGAECTLLPAAILAECLNIVADVASNVSIQSNIINFGKIEYADIFFKVIRKSTLKKFGVSTTIDGTEKIHNLSRDESYFAVRRGMTILDSYKVRMNYLCTITRHTIDNLDEFMEWIPIMLKESKEQLRFRLVEGEKNVLSKAQMRMYINAMHEAGFTKYMASFRSNDTQVSGSGCTILEIEDDGTAYPCNQDREITSAIGNIYESSLIDIIGKRANYFLSGAFEIHDDCLTCPKLQECHGGCPIYRVDGKANDCFIKRASIGKEIIVAKVDTKVSNKTISNALEYNRKLIVLNPKTLWTKNKITVVEHPFITKADSFNKEQCFCVCDCVCVSIPSTQDIADEFERGKNNVFDEADRAWNNAGDELERNRGTLLGIVMLANPFTFVAGIAMIGFGLTNQEDANQVYDVVTGKYSDDQQKVNDAVEGYNELVDKYEDTMDKLTDKWVMPDEVLQLVASAKLKRTQREWSAKLSEASARVDALVKEFQENYDFIQGVLKHPQLKYLMWLPLVVGGIASDAKGFFLDGDMEAGGRLLNILWKLTQIAILVAISILVPGGYVFTTTTTIAIITQIMDLVITLDSQYGQGVLMNAVFSMLDMLLNDVFNLKESWSELGTYMYSDAKYYQELTEYFMAINTIVNISAKVVMLSTTPENASAILMAHLPDTVAAVFSSDAYTTYEMLSTAYNGYVTYQDTVQAEEALQETKRRLRADTDKIYDKIAKLNARRLIQSYKQVEDMLTYSSNRNAEYVMSGFVNPTSTFDPEMTIAANFGYEYKGEAFMDFGISMDNNVVGNAGTDEYIANILYKL